MRVASPHKGVSKLPHKRAGKFTETFLSHDTFEQLTILFRLGSLGLVKLLKILISTAKKKLKFTRKRFIKLYKI